MANTKTPTRSEGSRLFFYGGGRSDGATPKDPVDPASQFSRPADYAGNSPQSFEDRYGGHPTTPPNANPAAMRGYTRNAPYMEDIVNSPQGIIEELRLLGYAPEDDVVSQYRKRVLMSALRDIYNVNPYDVGPGYVMGKSMAPVTPGSK